MRCPTAKALGSFEMNAIWAARFSSPFWPSTPFFRSDMDGRPIELYVGTAKLNWETGRAHVIDDTYPHSARYLGEHDEGEERC